MRQPNTMTANRPAAPPPWVAATHGAAAAPTRADRTTSPPARPVGDSTWGDEPGERGERGILARRRGLGALLGRSPMQPILRKRAARRLAVLSYQGVDDRESFRAQMERVASQANPVSLARVEESLAGGEPLPPHAVLVTLDQGHRSAVTDALPVLARAGVPAVAFVVAGLLGTERPLWWEEAAFLAANGGRARALPSADPADVLRQLRAMPDPDRHRTLAELRVSTRRQAPGRLQLTAADLGLLRDGGVEIGSQSQSYALLTRCDDATVRAEITDAHRTLTRLTGTAPTAFAYPDGAADPRAAAVLGELGYRSAFLDDHALFDHRESADGSPDPFRISRLRVQSTTSRRRFDNILSGLQPPAGRSA
ncbi:polysaccharide deacetylase family protein [Phaeacidiphilus oryzae]|uniref:polysaccharide deacetylase family protein n=1 Tax=Phaeacidiphilus oryzae TaxID=348818 RepID=UPI001F1A4EB1|nr:polysaccharide deacetylase family protein [Phaeacidiphilus oryzae]